MSNPNNIVNQKIKLELPKVSFEDSLKKAADAIFKSPCKIYFNFLYLLF